MLRLMGVLLIAGVLGGCDVVPGPIHSAHETIRHAAVDPGSVRFRSDYVAADGSVCGEFNAKNRMGGYVGFARYIATPSDENVYIASDEEVGDLVDDVDLRFTKDKWQELYDTCHYVLAVERSCPSLSTASAQDIKLCKLVGEGDENGTRAAWELLNPIR